MDNRRKKWLERLEWQGDLQVYAGGSHYHRYSANAWETARLQAWALLAILANKTWFRKEHSLREGVAAAKIARRMRGLPKGWVVDT